MNIKELQNYQNWIDKSAQTIFIEVLKAGGWKNIFPSSLPRWASRVRNYFNVSPSTLTRLPEDVAKRLLKQVQKFAFELECHEVQTFNRYHRDYHPNQRGELPPPPFREPKGCPVKASKDVRETSLTESIATKHALQGDVYKDDTSRMWYQMSAGAAIYHYGGEPILPSVEAVYVEKIKGQKDVPVFKLISPDGTGGSHEIIVKNEKGTDTIAAVNDKKSIRNLINTDEVHQGSYNYSETAQVGLAAHQMRDVKTHVGAWDFYVNPANRYWPLKMRVFPEKDPQGRPLAKQV